MSRIEVRKGSAAIKSGPYTTGGAVNLITTPIPQQFSALAKSSFGSFNSSEHHFWIGDSKALGLGWWRDFSSLVMALKSLIRVFIGRNMPRPNTGFKRKGALAKLAWNSDSASMFQRVELKLSTDTLDAKESYLG